MSTFVPLQRKSKPSNDVTAARKAAQRPAFRKPIGMQTVRAAWRDSAPLDWLLQTRRFAQPSLSNARSSLASRESVQSELPVQTKLEVSQPGDALEQEADRVAERVMRMPLDEVVPDNPNRTQVSSHSSTGVVQRACLTCASARDDAERLVQCSTEAEAQYRDGKVSTYWSQRFRAARLSGGEVLPPSVREVMEPRFGRSFDQVRVHHDETASLLAKGIGARAFTHGRDVFFKPSEFEPGTQRGQRLIAHELAHVVQQHATVRSVVHRVPVGSAEPGTCDPTDSQGFPLIYDRWGVPPRPAQNAVGYAQRKLNSFLRNVSAVLDKGTLSPPIAAYVTEKLSQIDSPKSPENQEDRLDVDCKFGQNTKFATQVFQAITFPSSSESTAAPGESRWDGKIGSITWPRLSDGAAAPTPAPTPPGSRSSYVLKEPPAFKQTGLTCWAGAMSSWLRVKGLVKEGFTPKYLVDYYDGTTCTGADHALDSADAINQVFAEWYLSTDISGTGIESDNWTYTIVKGLLEKHGQFILITGTEMTHAMVVYGVKPGPSDPLTPPEFNFVMLVVDPLSGMKDEQHHMVINYPLHVAVGMKTRVMPAPCWLKKAPRSKKATTSEGSP